MDDRDCKCTGANGVRSSRRAGLGAVTTGDLATTADSAASASEYGTEYRATKTAVIAGRSFTSSWASGGSAGGGTFSSALDDQDLMRALDESAAAAAEEKDRREDEFRKAAAATAAAVSLVCLACAPFAAAALLVLEGAVYLSELTGTDQNSPEDQEAVKELLRRYHAIGVIPPALRTDDAGVIGARGYRQYLENGLRYISERGDASRAAIYRVGELIKKHGAKPMLSRWTDRAAMSGGTVGGAPWPYNHSSSSETIAGIVAAAVALEYDLPFEPLRTRLFNVAETTRNAWAREDYGFMARAYANAAIAAFDYAADNAPNGTTLINVSSLIAGGSRPTNTRLAIMPTAGDAAAAREALGLPPPSRSAGVALRVSRVPQRPTRTIDSPAKLAAGGGLAIAALAAIVLL